MAQQRGTVAVAGAAGFVGRHVCAELLSRGYGVRGLVRDRERARAVLPRDPRLELVVGEATDDGPAGNLVRGCSACVNTIGIIREAGSDTFQKAHVDTVRSLVRACREGGVGRFAHISALGVWDEGPAKYQKTKFDGEMILRRSDLAWTIFRPSVVHGRGSKFIEMAVGWVSGDSAPWFFLPYFTRGVPTSTMPGAGVRREDPRVQPVAVEDVAWAVAQSLERPESVGEVYNLGGPDAMTWPDMLRAIRDAVPTSNAELEPLGVPAELAVVQAVAAKAVGLGGLLPFDAGMAQMGSEDSVASLAKARADLGFEPRPFLPALWAYAGEAAESAG